MLNLIDLLTTLICPSPFRSSYNVFIPSKRVESKCITKDLNYKIKVIRYLCFRVTDICHFFQPKRLDFKGQHHFVIPNITICCQPIKSGRTNNL